jgi:GNAT superfamily N-acetyltransferase
MTLLQGGDPRGSLKPSWKKMRARELRLRASCEMASVELSREFLKVFSVMERTPSVGTENWRSFMIVRPLVLADAPSAAIIHVDAWHDTYRGLMPDADLDAFHVMERTEFWTMELSQPNPNNNVLRVGAFEHDKLLGIAGGGRPRDELGFDSELWGVNIPKRFQKRGAGKRLMLAIVDYCLSIGANNMYLWCIGGNTNAMDFYSYLGAVDTVYRKKDDHRCLGWNSLETLRESLAR